MIQACPHPWSLTWQLSMGNTVNRTSVLSVVLIHHKAVGGVIAGTGQETLEGKIAVGLKDAEELEISHHLSNKGQISAYISQCWPKAAELYIGKQKPCPEMFTATLPRGCLSPKVITGNKF